MDRGPASAFGGTFYGVTGGGDPKQAGDIFGVATSGKERVLHEFGRGRDGNFPTGMPIVAGKTLFGTTQYGGEAN
jgi:uncharacterized repeat protein (TIGR03803 family)